MNDFLTDGGAALFRLAFAGLVLGWWPVLVATRMLRGKRIRWHRQLKPALIWFVSAGAVVAMLGQSPAYAPQRMPHGVVRQDHGDTAAPGIEPPATRMAREARAAAAENRRQNAESTADWRK